jgi:hypothetical protein
MKASIILVAAAAAAPARASIVRSCSDAVVQALKAQDMGTVAFFTHPTSQLRLAPYPYLTDADQRFGQSQAAALPGSPAVRLWGRYDGTGDPISKTFAQYYPEFLWKHDFTAGGITVGENVRVKTAHHSTNWATVYPGRAFVEYHYPGTAQYGQLDWWSLILVWQKHQGVWRLVCVTNDMQGV